MISSVSDFHCVCVFFCEYCELFYHTVGVQALAEVGQIGQSDIWCSVCVCTVYEYRGFSLTGSYPFLD